MAVVCHQCGTPCKDDDRFCANCGAALDSGSSSKSDPLVGRTIGGAYSLHELVGVGGMGRVYRAEQKTLGRTVAVKVIHPHLLGDEQTVARFYTEARAASRLNHPNSVSIIDFGRTDDGILYLVMEFLQGKDLAMVMHEEGPLPFPRIADAMIGVLGALGEAHALGVVHRDLKPENIIVKRLRSGGDLVKVVDFGLATIVSGAGATSITTPGLVCGTPDYMSPEQGRGETVDGRGDIYSLGVVLYELLTDQLPYSDETPTKVVLRHIHDPIPDPLTVAPHRGIPPSLAAVSIKALAKRSAERFQDAEEMQEALRQAMRAEATPQQEMVTCSSCGASNLPGMRFCGACGARLVAGHATPTGLASPKQATPGTSSVPAPSADGSPLLGRAAEMKVLEGLREEAKDHAVWVHVDGEPGAGKTRLVNEFARKAEAAGDAVVLVGPHPTHAPVPFHPVRQMLAALLGVSAEDLGELASTDEVFADPLVRAGVAEAASPAGLGGVLGENRVGAVSAAVATALRVASERAQSRQVLLVADGLSSFDGLSRDVATGLLSLVSDQPMMLITTGFGLQKNPSTHAITLHGLSIDTALGFFDDSDDERPSKPPSLIPGGRLLLPLYLEQVQALGAGPDETLPPRLADAVAQRIEGLDLEARKVMQAACVLGERCESSWLRALLETDQLDGLESLVEKRLVRLSKTEIQVCHPFVRDLVASSIPAEARRRLHERALQVASERDAPLEVRAEHAYRAGEPMSALMLLERMGDVAADRGDSVASVLAFRRALELGRRELLETGDLMLETAILTFSRKLGGALEQNGEIAGAEGVLREALDLAGPASSERARLLVALARVAARRDRRRDATRLLRHALEIAKRRDDSPTEALVQLGMARVRREDGDAIGAANALRRATELQIAIAAPAVQRATTLLMLSDVLLEVGDAEEAVKVLKEAQGLAERSNAEAVVARITGTLGSAFELEGRRADAAAQYRDAARLAAEAGDASSHDRWRSAAASLV
ncbi:MAG: protein kinase [Myxococcota bacterium]